MIDFVKLNIIVKYLRIATNRNRGISRRGKTYITKQRKLNPKGNRNRIRGWGREEIREKCFPNELFSPI